ncbi:MAG: phage protein Gp36 family protein [Pseudomonadota bacterium]|nr:phage protein Gp36 family protein [Pseudomonadota bacterium]
MFTTPKQLIDKTGINVLVQFANGKFGSPGTRITDEDVIAALEGNPITELQQQINAWYTQGFKNVNAIIIGYTAKLKLSQDEIESSVLPGIAIDLLTYELAPNSSDEDNQTKKKDALALLEKVSKGLIQIKDDAPVVRAGMRTKAAGTQFNWAGY